jgi:hypothetical protein
MDWRCGSSGKMPALQVRSHELKPLPTKKKKKKKGVKANTPIDIESTPESHAHKMGKN